MVAAEQVADLRKWLTASASQGLADGPFRFRHMRGLHFAKLFLIEQTATWRSCGNPIQQR